MMRTLVCVLGVLVFASTSVHAASRNNNLQRGGWGFLFPDHNSFANPGQFAISHGMALEAMYTQTSSSPKLQEAIPSLVFGNGTWGFGAMGGRAGTDLLKSNESVDYAALGFGVSLLKSRLTLGASYTALVENDMLDQGTIKATMTLNSSQRHGPAFGVGFTMPAQGTGAKTMMGGIGYIFTSNTSLEGNITFLDLEDLENFKAGAFFTVAPRPVYIALGGEYYRVQEYARGLGRIGVVLGGSFDISGLVTYNFQSGGTATYGGTVRISF